MDSPLTRTYKSSEQPELVVLVHEEIQMLQKVNEFENMVDQASVASMREEHNDLDENLDDGQISHHYS